MSHPASTASVLTELLTAQGRTVREGQAAAAAHIDSGDQHVAAMCPTGVGKSALAVAVSVARKGGVIAVNSNGLVAQYVAEIPEWEEALGVSIAPLVGSAHYWCPVASPTLAGLPSEAKDHVVRTGSFIGSGVEKSVYSGHSLAALAPVADEEDDTKTVSPCTDCKVRVLGSCPLWNARKAAADADVVVTNATVLGLSISGVTPWSRAIRRPVIVLDEADSCREPIASVLGAQITVKDEAAVDGPSALAVVRAWAADEDHKMVSKARRFLAMKRIEEEAGRSIGISTNDRGHTVLTILADLKEVFEDKTVVAMSATLSQRNVDDLGLSATVASFQGLDVSASMVTVQDDAPAWAYGAPADWAAHVANELTQAFRSGGRTLGLFQSNVDKDAVVAALPADVKAAVLEYSSKTDRTSVVQRYTANPDKHLLIGLVQGAGRGLNLPGELLRKVIVSRVPQNAPRGADRAVWAEDSRASITQSVGRAHRAAGDWGHVTIVGGFGRRTDVAKALTDLGWKIS
jgi:Rad3-related DNA helicase